MAIDDLRLESDRRLATILLSLVLIPAVWFTAVDAMAPLDALGGAMRPVPMATSVAVLSLGVWFVSQSRTRAQYSVAVFAVSVAIVPILLSVALVDPRGWFYEPSAAFLPLIALYGAMPNTASRQILPPVLLTAGLLVGRTLWFSEASEDAIGDTLIIIVVNAIGIVMVLRRIELQRMVAASFDELQALRGIIPICAHCKKVRTEGDTWQQIEKYVHEHSAADFSHGICPDCIRAYYPDDADLADQREI
jgi:hypothetical protein